MLNTDFQHLAMPFCQPNAVVVATIFFQALVAGQQSVFLLRLRFATCEVHRFWTHWEPGCWESFERTWQTKLVRVSLKHGRFPINTTGWIDLQ